MVCDRLQTPGNSPPTPVVSSSIRGPATQAAQTILNRARHPRTVITTPVAPAARWLALMTLLLYLGPVSMGTVPRPTPTPTVTDTCCTVCTQGGPCCCLANGAVSCNLTYIAGLILRPAPCSRPTTPAIPAAGGTADHVMPAMVRGTDPLARELPVRTWTGTASSIALGPPDKIPIV